MHTAPFAATAARLFERAGPWLREAVAGAIAATIILSYALSYSALMFHDAFASGMPIVLWAMLIGAAIGGVAIAVRTTLPPVACGTDIPQAAVMVALAGAVTAAASGQGLSPDNAIRHALVALTATTAIFGGLCLAIGGFGLARYVRLVPYGVVAGFTVATGVLLAAGGAKLALGRPLSWTTLADGLAAGTGPRLLVAVLFAALLLVLRRISEGSFVLPAAIVGGALVVDLILSLNNGSLRASGGWFLQGLDRSAPWRPLAALGRGGVDGALLLRFLPEMLAIASVGILSIIVKTAVIETQRATSADLDAEFRGVGMANLVATPLGGLATSVLVSPSRLLTTAGGQTRWSGAVAGLTVGAIVLAGFDLPGLLPVPILAGLIVFVAYGMISDSLRRICSQRDWGNLLFALAVAATCIVFGYLPGILSGFLGACMLFAVTYSRIGLIRRTATRATFASDVDHGPAADEVLRRRGEAIHIYWLSGYLFFGSSDVVFERVRDTAARADVAPLRYLVLDFAEVTGADATAVASFLKLRNFADRRGLRLVFCGAGPVLEAALARDGLFGTTSRHRAFANRQDGLEWCELEVLAAEVPAGAGVTTPAAPVADDFIGWLQREVGDVAGLATLGRYFEHRRLEAPCQLYEQGANADAIDFVAAGTLTVSLRDSRGRMRRLRRIRRHAVVGEMGFFRNAQRMATVSVDGPADLYTLHRDAFERMRREQPELAIAFVMMITRTLAERLDFASQEIASWR
jgi:sulfate permease, SulP family